MCQKNHYPRRIITTLLAIITALLVFGATLTNAQSGIGSLVRYEGNRYAVDAVCGYGNQFENL